MKKPKKLLNNLGLKILALAFAVLLWMVVININDPVGEKTFRDIKVEMKNTSMLTDEGKTYEVLEGTDRISVTVRASRSVLESITAEDITAAADFSELSFTNTVPIRLTVDRYLENRIQEVKGSADIMKLQVEDRVEKQLMIEMVQAGKPANDFIVSKIAITDGNAMKISGPESLVSQVAKAVVEADVEGLTDSITISEKIRLLDAEGKEITDNRITKSVGSANLAITILRKKEVPLSLSVKGEPAPGYEATGEISCAPEKVTIAGKSNVVKEITEIVIPPEELALTGARADVTKLVDVTKYLPDGVSLVNGSEEFGGKAAVTVKIEPLVEATVPIDRSRIVIQNVPEGYEVTLDPEEAVAVSIRGRQDELSLVDRDSLTGSIDVAAWMERNGAAELTEGREQMEVQIPLPDGVSQADQVRAVVHITRKAEEADEQPEAAE